MTTGAPPSFPVPMATSGYPRVLIVMINKVQAEDSVNLLVRSEFGGWPKERLAQIHTGQTSGRGEFCGRYYRLQEHDRVLGRLFRRLRSRVSDMTCADTIPAAAAQGGPPKRWPGRVIAKRIGDALIDTGVWEILFRLRPSEQMLRFVDDFQPEIIYCQGYSLGFATLSLALSRQFHVPICFQTMDDWPHRVYRLSPVRWLLRRRARQLVRQAAVRLAWGEKMRGEYEGRYGVSFDATYHLDDPGRFPQATTPLDPATIVYTGGLGHRRYEAIQDVLGAVRTLGARARIVVYSAAVPKDMPQELLEAREITFRALPSHDQLPSVLASASILLLPESFNESREAIEFSLSTKAHLYMMASRPILVYGPEYSGTVGYARREGWAEVVTARDQGMLAKALADLLENQSVRRDTAAHALRCVRANHDIKPGQSRFRVLICAATARPSPCPGAAGEEP